MTSYSVGIGITNRCNLNCAHCYSREANPYDLTYQQFVELVDRVPIHSVNFGTGESALHPDFVKILDLLSERNIKFSITSNGYTTMSLPDHILKKIHDVDISVDYGFEVENDTFRSKGSFQNAINSIKRLKSLGVEVSLVSCMTNKNFSEFGNLFEIVKSFDINLRVNIYKPVHNTNLSLSYDQFWNGIQYLFSYGELIACSEPVVNTVIQDRRIRIGCNCGKGSFRVKPSGEIVPCVYWGESTLKIEDISSETIEADQQFKILRTIPEFCRDCEFLEFCEGGCGGRRYYNDITQPDPYCYKYQKREKPELKATFAESKDLIHANYLCTIIMK